ncbi:MAG: hypothetical protein ACW99G_24155 [Candidatus Thorarchaeota archaeon]|jgi:hypothetical protein
MNKIIKVYGHHRSGNNYLCALLYKNFYSGMESVARTIDRGERRFILFGEEVKEQEFVNPYGNLFGSHNPQDVTQNSIYIIRHVYVAVQKRPFVVYYEDLCSQTEKVLREIQQHFELVRLFRNFITDVGYCGWPD